MSRHLGLLGTIVGVALLSGIVTSSSGQETTVDRGTPSSDGTFLQRIVRSSQAITDVRVGECLDERDRRADERKYSDINCSPSVVPSDFVTSAMKMTTVTHPIQFQCHAELQKQNLVE